MKEAPIQRQIMLAASALGTLIFRNTVSGCVLGKFERMRKDGPVMLKEGDYIVRQGRPAMCGLAEGSADLVGLRTVEITTDMIGKKVAQFVSIEVKSPAGPIKKNQQNWLRVMREKGACAGIVRSIVEAENLLRRPL